jgi:hypothetical protein
MSIRPNIRSIIKDIQDNLNTDLNELENIPDTVKTAFMDDICSDLNTFATTLEKYSVIFESYDQ